MQLEMMSLRLSGEAPQKVQRAYRTHAEALQQLLSELTAADWPGPDPVTRVEVEDRGIRVTWTTAGHAVQLAPIPREEIGL